MTRILRSSSQAIASRCVRPDSLRRVRSRPWSHRLSPPLRRVMRLAWSPHSPSDGYTWNVSTDGTTYTAVPKTVNGHDYILSGQTEFTFDIAQLTGHQCQGELTPVTAEASATPGSCAAAGQVVLGDNEGYLWSDNTGTADEPIYTATATDGFALTASGEFAFHGIAQLTGHQCQGELTPVTAEASATLGSCAAAGHVTLGDSEGYLWSDNTGTADEPIYTATANTGYLLTASGEFKFHGISKFDPPVDRVLRPAGYDDYHAPRRGRRLLLRWSRRLGKLRASSRKPPPSRHRSRRHRP